MRPKEKNVIDKTQPEAGFLDSGVKEIHELWGQSSSSADEGHSAG